MMQQHACAWIRRWRFWVVAVFLSSALFPSLVIADGPQQNPLVKDVFGDVLDDLNDFIDDLPEGALVDSSAAAALIDAYVPDAPSRDVAAPAQDPDGTPTASQDNSPVLRQPSGVVSPSHPEASTIAAPVAKPSFAAPPTITPPRTADVTEDPRAKEMARVSPVPERPRVIPRNVALVRQPVERALRMHMDKHLNAQDDSCWSMMHAFLGWGANTKIRTHPRRGGIVNAAEWLANNQSCAGRRLFYLDGNRIRGREGPGYQGHPGQFLAMAAQCNLDPGFPMQIQGRQFQLSDLIEEEKRSCSVNTELTFKLIALAHYLGTDVSWQSWDGETWDVERLLSVEISEPVNGVACGGTHRLMGISYALAKRQFEERSVDGTWATAQNYLNDYHTYTFSLFNRDGSFSADWFKFRSDRGDLDRKIQTTGHVVEWLVFSLPKESLHDPRLAKSVHFLADSLVRHRFHDWEVGPKGHAIRALRLYHQRVFRRTDPQLAPVSRQQVKMTASR